MKPTKNSKNGMAGNQSFRYVNYAILVVAILLFVLLTMWFDFVQDDAFITFRYAANFINGEELVFNQGERIEGYTNFLWLIFIIIGLIAGIEPILFSKVLGILFGTGAIIVLYKLGEHYFADSKIFRAVPSLILGSTISFGYWSASGLETACFTFLVVVSVWLYCRQSFLLPSVLAIATMVRPEGFLIFCMIVAYEIIIERKIPAGVIYIAALYVVLLAPFVIFKLLYFGKLLPNPFFAKVGFGFERLSDGITYLFRYARHYLAFGLFLIPALLAIRKSNKGYGFILGLVIVYAVYIVLVGGDVLKVHRFFVPIMPLTALIITIGITSLSKNKAIAIIGLALVIGWQVFMPYGFIRTYYTAERGLVDRMTSLAQKLKKADKSDFSLAVSTIGAISYYLPGHTVIDMLGLTDSTIARYPEETADEIHTTWKERNYNVGYVLSRQPDYIVFSTGRKPSAPAEKALYFYSDFLSNYRTVPFEILGDRNDIFKRYPIIRKGIKKDIKPEFVVHYLRGLENKVGGRFQAAISDFERALRFIPEDQYSLARYNIAECLRLMKKHPQSYELLLSLAGRDSLTYEVYKDLYTYEYLAYKNMERAEYYRARLVQLIPWYITTLDDRIRRWNRP